MPTAITSNWPLSRSPIALPNVVGGAQRQQMMTNLHSYGLNAFNTTSDRFAQMNGYEQNGTLLIPGPDGAPPTAIGFQENGVRYFAIPDRAPDGGAICVTASPTGTVNYRILPATPEGNRVGVSITPFPGGAMNVSETLYDRSTAVTLQSNSYTLQNGSYINYQQSR